MSPEGETLLAWFMGCILGWAINRYFSVALADRRRRLELNAAHRQRMQRLAFGRRPGSEDR